jgi:hypothetical protein
MSLTRGANPLLSDPRFQQKPGELYVIGGCDSRMQKKMFRDAF